MNRPVPRPAKGSEPAASYGQTAQTLLSQALGNTLPAQFTGAGPNNPPVMGGSPYGSY